MRILALTEVETVALWAGLLVGVASVVLAIVAIYFSVEVDRRSSRVSTATIKSLERIQGVVESQSRDTRDLIKVGWERMLPVPGGAPTPDPSIDIDTGMRQIAAGLADEIRTNLGIDSRNTDAEPAGHGEAWSDVERRLLATLESQLHARRGPGDEVQYWLDRLESVSEEAQAMVRSIRSAHVTMAQLDALSEDPAIRDVFHELRGEGILVPLRGRNRDGERELVYWFPPGIARAVRAAIMLLPDPESDVVGIIEDRLRGVGYPDRP